MKRAAAGTNAPVPANHVDSGAKTAAPEQELWARQDSQPVLRKPKAARLVDWFYCTSSFSWNSSTRAEDHGPKIQRNWSAI
jgi:hypothetical protein